MPACPECNTSYDGAEAACPRCGTPAPPAEPRDPLVGRTLAGKYRVVSVLGEGGMGRVYRAEHATLGVDVVIKTLHAHMAADAEIVQRFFREAQSASRLRHPNCIDILDFGESDGTVYMAMEFLRGDNLADALAEAGRFPPPRAVHVASQVLSVIEAAHRLGIVHRDLKPENIMIEDLPTQRDFVKVLDFGIAKVLDPIGGARLTQTGVVVGTPAYMAPEQAMGQRVDERSDLYSIGVICFELLSGRLPFDADTPAAFLAAHAYQEPPPLITVRPDLPPKLAAAVDRALAKSPRDRYQTAAEMQRALEDAIAGAPATATAPLPTATAALAPAAPRLTGSPCSRCGEPMPPGAKFCPECGATTGRATRAPTADDARFAELRRVLPSTLIDEIVQMAPAERTERRDIAVLSIEAGGPALYDADPADAERTGADLDRAVRDAAGRRGGLVAQRQDGGYTVAFGVRTTGGDDAERAVLTAFDIRDWVADGNRTRHARLEVSAAVHVGPARVTAGPGAASYTAIGDTVALPAALARAVEPGAVVVSDAARDLVRGAIRTHARAAVRVRGHAGAVGVHEAIEPLADADRAPAVDADAAGFVALPDPPLVGRRDLIAAVGARARDAAAGAGAFVHLTGEPGCGKTRALTELAAQLARAGACVVRTTARPGADGRARVVADVVAGVGGTEGGLRALGVDAGALRILTACVRGIDATEPIPAGDRAGALAAAVRDAIERRARHGVVAVLVDDAHWADPPVAHLLAAWAADPPAGALIVTAARDGHALPWSNEGGHGTVVAPAGVAIVRVEPLTPDEIAAIASHLLAPNAPPAAVRAVAERAGGSPRMAIDLVHRLIETGALRARDGRWHLTVAPETISLPDTAAALFAARIDALPAYTRDVLACAAVCGDDMPVAIVTAVMAGVRDIPIDRDLALLRTRGLLHDAGGRVRFPDGRIRDLVYERLPDGTRRALHRAIARAIDASRDTGVPPEVAASHYAKAGDDDLAVQRYIEARDAAAGAPARRAAILRGLADAARAGLSGPSALARNRTLAEASIELGELLVDAGDLDAAARALAEGLACAQMDDAPDLIARAKRGRGRARVAAGKVDEALRDLQSAAQLASGLRDRSLAADIHIDLGEAHERRGALDEATRHLLHALELAQTGDAAALRRAALRALAALGRVRLRSGDPAGSERFLLRALELAQADGEHAIAARVLGNLAAVHHARGDARTARALAERSLAMARDCGDRIGVARQHVNLASVCAALGDAAAARQHAEDAYAAARAAGWREGMAAAAAARR